MIYSRESHVTDCESHGDRFQNLVDIFEVMMPVVTGC